MGCDERENNIYSDDVDARNQIGTSLTITAILQYSLLRYGIINTASISIFEAYEQLFDRRTVIVAKNFISNFTLSSLFQILRISTVRAR